MKAKLSDKLTVVVQLIHTNAWFLSRGMERSTDGGVVRKTAC